MKRIWLLAILLALSACDDPATAKRAAEDMGLTNVETRGWAMFGCGKDDDFCTKFTATNPNGRRVSGVVGSGWLKGATVRFN